MKVGDLVKSLHDWRYGAFGIITGRIERDLWRIVWVDPTDKGKMSLHNGEWCTGAICRGRDLEVVR